MDIILGWNLYFRIILSILSAKERTVESQEISGHLKRLIDFVLESKKLLNALAITYFLEEFLPFPCALC